MRVIAFDQPGGPDVLRVRELPPPAVGADELLVRVTHAAVNPADTMLRAGLTPPPAGPGPYMPGWDMSGIVVSAPPSSTHRRGDRVMAAVDPLRESGGSYAELVRVPARSAIPVPASWSAVTAAAAPMNALTAIQALRLGEAEAARTILVTGGAGVLGGFVRDLLRDRTTPLYVDCLPPHRDDIESAIVLGRGPGLDDRLRRIRPEGVDLVIDCAVTGTEAEDCLRDGGRLVCVRPHRGPADRGVVIARTRVALELENRAALATVADAAAGDILRPRIADVLPVERAAEAHRLLERGGLPGRIVLAFD